MSQNSCQNLNPLKRESVILFFILYKLVCLANRRVRDSSLRLRCHVSSSSQSPPTPISKAMRSACAVRGRHRATTPLLAGEPRCLRAPKPRQLFCLRFRPIRCSVRVPLFSVSLFLPTLFLCGMLIAEFCLRQARPSPLGGTRPSPAPPPQGHPGRPAPPRPRTLVTQ